MSGAGRRARRSALGSARGSGLGLGRQSGVVSRASSRQSSGGSRSAGNRSGAGNRAPAPVRLELRRRAPSARVPPSARLPEPSAQRPAPALDAPMLKSRRPMPVVKLHKTVGVRVGAVQVGGGAPVVVQSMTMTDTADAGGDGAAVHRAGRGGLRDGPGHGQPARSRRGGPRDQAAACSTPGVTAPLIGDFHYNGHLLLTRYPGLRRRRSTSTASTPATSAPASAATSSSRPSARSPATTARPVRIGVNGGSLNQELVLSRMQENTDRDLGPDLRRDHQRVHGALGAAVDRARAGVRAAQGPDHHLVQDVAAARSDCRLPRPVAQDRSAAAPRPHRGRHGHQRAGLVGRVDGRAAQRGHRRHHPRLADAAAGRRSPRRGLRRVRAAAGARAADLRAERHRLPRLRPHHQQHVPGAGRAHAGLHPRAHAASGRRSTKASRR